MGKADPPAPPDYVGAAHEQGQQNLQSAFQQWQMNNPSIDSPYGNINYTGPGGGAPTGPGGITQHINLSPFEQGMFNNAQGIRQGMVPIVQDLQSQIANMPSMGRDSGEINRNVVDALYKQRTNYLDPQFQQRESGMDAQLRAQGLVPGSVAYNDAMGNLEKERQSAYSDALSSAQGQGTAAGMAATQEDSLRQHGLMDLFQQLSGYLTPQGPSGGGVAPISGIQGGNILGATQAGYDAALGGVNAENAQSAQTTSTLASLALAAAMAFCWTAYAAFGPSDDFMFARLWLQHGWKGRIAGAFRWVYRRIGPWLGAQMIQSEKLRKVIRPALVFAAKKGRTHASS